MGNTQTEIKQSSNSMNDEFTFLQNGIEDFFKSTLYSDMTLCVKEIEFPVHRIILAKYSKVFKAEFEVLQTKNINKMHIKDTDPEVVTEMLRYMYTDKIESIDTVAIELFMLADAYQIWCLRSECLNYLKDHINFDNIFSVLYMIGNHDCSILEDRVTKFITENITDFEKLCFDKWEEFIVEQPALAVRIMRECSQIRRKK